MSQVAEAFVRVRPDFSGFKTSTLSGIKTQMQDVSKEADRVGQTVTQSARDTVTAETKKRQALQQSLDAYKQLASQAKKGSEEQVAANNLAADSARKLGLSAAESGTHLKGTEQELSALTRGATRGLGVFKNLNSALVFGGAGFVGAAGVTETIKTAVDAASDLQEQMHRTDDVFKESGPEIQAWAKTAADSLGLSTQAALEASSTVGTLLQNVGLVPARAAEMSKSIVQLASDMAAFKKVAPETALSALESGLQGRTRSLKQFGLVIDNTTLKAEALSTGILKSNVDLGKVQDAETRVGIAQEKYNAALAKNGQNSVQAAQASLTLSAAHKALEKATAGSTGALTAEQKALALYSLVMKQTKDQQGAFARDQDDLSVQQMKFKANLQDLEAEIGTALLPTVTKYTEELSKWMSDAKDSGQIQKDVTEAAKDFQAAVSVVTEVVEAGAKAFGLLNDATGSAKTSIEVLGAAFLVFKARAQIQAIIAADIASLGKLDAALATTATVAETEGAAAAGGVAEIGGAADVAAVRVGGLQTALLKVGLQYLAVQQIIKNVVPGQSDLGFDFSNSVTKDKYGAGGYPIGTGQNTEYQLGLSGKPDPAATAVPNGQSVIGPGSPAQHSAAYLKGLAQYQALHPALPSLSDLTGAGLVAGAGAGGSGGGIPDLTGGAGSGGSKGLSATAVASLKQRVSDLIDKSKGIFPDSVKTKLEQQGKDLLDAIQKGLGPDAAAQVRSDVTAFGQAVSADVTLDKSASKTKASVDKIKKEVLALPDGLQQQLQPKIDKASKAVENIIGPKTLATAQTSAKELSTAYKNNLKLDSATDAAETKLDEFKKKVSAAPKDVQQEIAPGMAKVRSELGNVVTQSDLARAKSDFSDLTASLTKDLKKQQDAVKANMTALAAAVKTASGPFETAFGDVANIALTLFDRNVQKHLDGMQATLTSALSDLDDQLNSTLATIQKNQAALTPTESLIAQMQDAKNTADLAAAISDAQKQVTDDAASSAKSIADAQTALATAKDNLAKGQTGTTSQATIDQLRQQLQAAQATVDANSKNPASAAAQAAGANFRNISQALDNALSSIADPDTLKTLQQAVDDATQALTDAQQNAGDQQQADAKAVDDAIYNQKVAALQKQADLERTAADQQAADDTTAAQKLHDTKSKALQDQYDLDAQNYQDQEDLQRTSLSQQLSDLQTHLEARGTTVADANADILKLVTAFGLDPTWFTAGSNSGSALVQGLATALGSASSTLSALQTANDAIAAAQALQAKLTGGPSSTAPVGSNQNPHDGTTGNADILTELKKQTAALTKPPPVTVVVTGSGNQSARDALQ